MSKMTTLKLLKYLGIEVGKPYLHEGRKEIITEIHKNFGYIKVKFTKENGEQIELWKSADRLINKEITLLPETKDISLNWNIEADVQPIEFVEAFGEFLTEKGWYGGGTCGYAQEEVYAPTYNLDEDEKAVIINLPIAFKWITRDANNMLNIWDSKPEKINNFWGYKVAQYSKENLPTRRLFQFISWEDEQPVSITELKRCL